MHNKFLPVVLLAIGISAGASAQTKEKIERKEKKETVTIRKDKDSKEKTTIVIDGDNITVNGKPLSELKDSEIEVFRGDIAPFNRFKSFGPQGGVKMFGDEFPFNENRAFLGVGSSKDQKGAKINTIEEESGAEKAGLKKDDIITKVGDTKITNSEDLYDAISKYKPEEKITITYLRDGKEAQATATLGKSNMRMKSFSFDGDDFNKSFNFKMPAMPGFEGMDFSSLRKPRLGLEIQDVENGKGVKVLDVDDESAAEKAGLKKDDVITDIDGKAVNSVDELRAIAKELKEGTSLKVTYVRAGKTGTATISFPKKLKTAEL